MGVLAQVFIALQSGIINKVTSGGKVLCDVTGWPRGCSSFTGHLHLPPPHSPQTLRDSSSHQASAFLNPPSTRFRLLSAQRDSDPSADVQIPTLMLCSCYGPKHGCEAWAPSACGSLTQFLDSYPACRKNLSLAPHTPTPLQSRTSRATNVPCFSPCHWMSSVHWKTLPKPLDKQVLWDLSAKFRFWPLASSLFAANLFCQTPEDTCSFLFPCLLAHWQGTPEGLWLLWSSWWAWDMLFIWLISSKHCAGQVEVNPVLPIRLYQNSKIYKASLNQKSENSEQL